MSSSPTTNVHIAPATPDDVPTLMALIRGLAEYEKLTHQLRMTPEALREHLFGPRPYAEAVIARVGGEPVGHALWFHNYSTFLAKPGLYLEDVFVVPGHRGRGVGSALLRHVARVARERGCGRFEWSVLDWNEPAISFYRKIGAEVLPNWRVCRMDEGALARLADSE
jgi:GNAT superfamily N-acetyltransferase